MIKYVPRRIVYEHAQDTPHDCGRACVQMVISSLILGPPTGTPPSAADEKVPIPVTQVQLRQRELDPIDVVTVESWKTHPDELLALLVAAPELAGPLSNWSISVHDHLDELYAALVVALRGGMPAILNLYSSDHWAVVSGVAVENASSALLFIEVLDPLPQDPRPHTYIDDCSREDEGLTIADPVKYDTQQLANLQLVIGGTPSPLNLTHYEGKFLAIVHESLRDQLKALLEKWRTLPIPPPIDPHASVTIPIDAATINAMRTALQLKAHAWQLTRLGELLASPHETLARHVHDVESTLAPYYLLSLFSSTLGYGVVGAFDVAEHQPLHFRFTNDRKFAQSLEKRPSEMLWWTRGWLSTLRSPYFPFARTLVNNKFTYQRLFDDFTFERDA